MGPVAGTFSLALVGGPWLGVVLLDRFGGPVALSGLVLCGLAAAALAGRRTGPSN